MKHWTRNILLVLTVATLAGVLGCFADTRTSNQGGGSLLTVAAKLAQQDVGSLNADEWQILTDNAPTLASYVGADVSQVPDLPELTDEQAQAIVDFLSENNISTFNDLSSLQQMITNGQVTIPDELVGLAEELFATFTGGSAT